MFVSHLESALDGTRFEPEKMHSVHQGRPLWVRYDLPAIESAVQPSEIVQRPPSLWRYRELLPLPLDQEPVTLGEGMSPLLPCPRLGKEVGFSRLFIKDESQLPTGTFKSRGMTVAVSMARYLGLTRLAIPTAGNAGGALAAYGARAGMEVFVFMPADTPHVNQMEAFLAGAKVFLVNGLIHDCGRLVREGTARMGWFDMSTLKEPYRLEGKKTMGLELAEQLGWRLPDVILYPTGGGTGLIGMWKAFRELQGLRWLEEAKMPRMIACQSDGCAPIVKAFEAGQRFAEPWTDARTVASGLRVPSAVGDFMILDAIRESSGRALAGREDRIVEWMQRVAALEGIGICPETAVCFDCLEQLQTSGRLKPDEEIVVFNTGAAQKYLEAVPFQLPRVEQDDADGDWGYNFNAEHLSSPDETLRRWAVIHISRQRLKSYESLLVKMLATEPSYAQRRHVVRALGNIGTASAVPVLLGILKLENGLIVGDAAQALGKLNATEAREELNRHTASEIEWVAQNCRYALKRLSEINPEKD